MLRIDMSTTCDIRRRTQVEVWSLLVVSRVEPAKRLLSRPRLGWLRSI